MATVAIIFHECALWIGAIPQSGPSGSHVIMFLVSVLRMFNTLTPDP